MVLSCICLVSIEILVGLEHLVGVEQHDGVERRGGVAWKCCWCSLKTTRSEQMGLSMPWSVKLVLVPRPWDLILRNGSCLVGVENVVESFVGVGLKTTRSEQMGLSMP